MYELEESLPYSELLGWAEFLLMRQEAEKKAHDEARAKARRR